MTSRVVVFVDYQNVYHSAREAFGDPKSDPPTLGHVQPAALGALLVEFGQRHYPDRELQQVRVYRGAPGPQSHPNLQAASSRQIAAWDRQRPLVEPVTRPLRYQPLEWDHTGRPTRWDTGREKGIDVLLALDVALGAVRDDYDVAVVVSGDTDLIPAIDEALRAGKWVENAVWRAGDRPPRPLRSTYRRIWSHYLDRGHFERVRDDTDYLAHPDT